LRRFYLLVREGTSQVRLRHDAPVVRATFDDPNLVSCAGLVPVMRLARQAGLHDAVADRVRLPTDKGSNPAGKVATVVAGMLAGADSIDDLGVARHGGMRSLFTCVYAPSTLGAFLRTFTHGHVRQVQAAARDTLIGLAGRAPLLTGADVLTFVDIDSMLRRVYGKQKQGIGFGHAKVGGYNVWLRGYNPLIATLSTPLSAPVIAATRLRAGNAGSARGAASMIAEAVTTARSCGATGEIVVRADSAFYAKTVITTCRRRGVRFSVTTRIDAKIRAGCESIADSEWIDIKYPQAVWDDDAGRWISDAQIAETTYTAFAGTRHAVTARLIVRRVRRDDPAQIPGQEELLPQYRYHAVFTDSPYTLVQAEAQHRRHAIIEQVNADLIAGALAHLPSGRFSANDAWLTCAAIAHNLTRAAGHLAGGTSATARPATIRTRIITVAARLAHRARRIHLHLPEHWPWQTAFDNLFTTVQPTPG
jgi:hypothetical protein